MCILTMCWMLLHYGYYRFMDAALFIGRSFHSVLLFVGQMVYLFI
uniref:Uncharacterized protein n=1 Tax=Setaria italica TaxID=4555 RepID=K4AND1_SETIT